MLLSEDVNGAANKLIALKAEFPKADVFAIMASRPKTLLQSEQTLLDNAKQVGAAARLSVELGRVLWPRQPTHLVQTHMLSFT